VARQLDVYSGTSLVGILEQDDAGQLHFAYAATWLAGGRAWPLSQSLPLRATRFGNREARPFFAGLLPEAEKRDLVARALGITARNDFALLDKIGGECAGAITFMAHGALPQPSEGATGYRSIDETEIARILRLLPERPLLAGERRIRLSLAGAQDKLPVLLVDGGLALPLDGNPSSHILKPQIRRHEDTVHNEGFCLALARALAFPTIASELRKAGTESYLLVARYDRIRETDGSLRRLHQEDICQALAIPPELKYQGEGGPTLRQCFQLVRQATTLPVVSLQQLLDAVVFNVLIGNNDAHGKNFSLLYGDRGVELAPLYDVSSTIVYPDLSPRFAMKVGDQHQFDDLHPRHWDRFAGQAGLGAPQVRRRLLSLARQAPRAAERVKEMFSASGQHRPIIDRIVALIHERASATLRRFAAEKAGVPTREDRRG